MLLEDAAVDADVEWEEVVLVLLEAEERILVSLRTAATGPEEGGRLAGLCL